MTMQEQINTIQARITQAQSSYAAWRDAGREDKVLEAYTCVEVLALQLEDCLHRSGRRITSDTMPGAWPC